VIDKEAAQCSRSKNWLPTAPIQRQGWSAAWGRKPFYIRLAGMILQEENFDKLEQALAAGDLKEAFSAAHALKGVTGNLALTPLYEPVQEITELLRAETDMDYTALMNQIREAKAALQQLADEA
jgi:hypothetical protein